MFCIFSQYLVSPSEGVAQVYFVYCLYLTVVFFLKRNHSVYLLVSCLRRPSWAPSGFCGRWASWDMTELRVLTPDVRAWSSCVVRTTDPKSPSSSSSTSSASLSAPSLSDAGPKCVCSSRRETDAKASEQQVLCFLYFCPSLTHTHLELKW